MKTKKQKICLTIEEDYLIANKKELKKLDIGIKQKEFNKLSDKKKSLYMALRMQMWGECIDRFKKNTKKGWNEDHKDLALIYAYVRVAGLVRDEWGDK